MSQSFCPKFFLQKWKIWDGTEKSHFQEIFTGIVEILSTQNPLCHGFAVSVDKLLQLSAAPTHLTHDAADYMKCIMYQGRRLVGGPGV